MTWDFTPDRPIYTQLIEQIQLRIVSGRYPPGSKLDSVRDLAAEAAVNPNTMQRALSELERLGLLHTQRTSGRTVTEDEDRIFEIRQDLAQRQVEEFLFRMEQLGYSQEETLLVLKQIIEEEAQK